MSLEWFLFSSQKEKLPKIKDFFFLNLKNWHNTHRGTTIWKPADFSSEAMKTVKQHFWERKENNSQPRSLYSVKVPLRNDNEIKTFSHEPKIKDCHKQICSLKSDKRSFSGWKEIIPEGHVEQQERRKNNKDGKYLGKYNRLFFFFN